MRKKCGTNKGCGAQGKCKDESGGKNQGSAASDERAAAFEGQGEHISILVSRFPS